MTTPKIKRGSQPGRSTLDDQLAVLDGGRTDGVLSEKHYQAAVHRARKAHAASQAMPALPGWSSRRARRKLKRERTAQATVVAMRARLAPQIAELDAKVAAGLMTPDQRESQIQVWLSMQVLAASRQMPAQGPDWLG